MIRGSLELDLRTAQRALPFFMRQEAQHASVAMAIAVRRHTPIGRIVDQRTGQDMGPSGALKASVVPSAPTRQANVGGDRWRGGAESDLYYASYVEYGTRPHVISAGPGRALHFWAGGHEVFAKRVMHPGFSGRHMFLLGALEVERSYDRDANVRVQALWDRIFKTP